MDRDDCTGQQTISIGDQCDQVESLPSSNQVVGGSNPSGAPIHKRLGHSHDDAAMWLRKFCGTRTRKLRSRTVKKKASATYERGSDRLGTSCHSMPLVLNKCKNVSGRNPGKIRLELERRATVTVPTRSAVPVCVRFRRKSGETPDQCPAECTVFGS